MPSDPLTDLTDRWRDDAEALERNGCGARAELLRRHAEEVEDALRRRQEERVTVDEAARISGYSEKHLRRLVRDGKLPAHRPGGDGGRILLQRGDLPRKPASGDDDTPADRHVRKIRSP